MTVHTPAADTRKKKSVKDTLRRLSKMNEFAVFSVVLVVFVALSFVSPYFLTEQNLRTLLIGMAAEGIVVVGMTLALASGGFDLSVGSVMGLAAVVVADLYIKGFNIWLAVLCGVLVGIVVGGLNGWLISAIEINPFITTLGTMTAARGIIYVITDGSSLPVTTAPEAFRWLGTGSILGIPVIVLIFLVVAIAGDYLMRRSSFARQAFYVGSNSKAAALSGISVPRVLAGVYLIVGVLAAIAGILTLARFGTATPAMGSGVEMRVISAAVIGGASIAGGAGTVLGSVLGLFLLSLINNALVLMNVSVNWQSAISGLILIVAVGIDSYSKKRARIKGGGR